MGMPRGGGFNPNQMLKQLQKMQREMDKAIAAEAYERAAELRDQIKAYGNKKNSAS